MFNGNDYSVNLVSNLKQDHIRTYGLASQKSLSLHSDIPSKSVSVNFTIPLGTDRVHRLCFGVSFVFGLCLRAFLWSLCFRALPFVRTWFVLLRNKKDRSIRICYILIRIKTDANQ